MSGRSYKDIEFTDNSDGTLTLKHLVGDMTVPCNQGAYILPVPCGGGKSTGITSLVKLFSNEGFVIFEKTRYECDQAHSKLVKAGVGASEIDVVYSGRVCYDELKTKPSSLTKRRVLIIPSVHLYINFLPSILAYNGGTEVDLEPYSQDLKSLLTSNYVRRFILIDEQPDFIQPYVSLPVDLTLSNYSRISKRSGGVKLDANNYLYPLPIDQMRLKDDLLVRSKAAIFGDHSPLSYLKRESVLRYIYDEFATLGRTKQRHLCIYHYIKELVVKGMRCNIYIFDATAAVLNQYKKSGFHLIESSTKSYSSDIEFSRFVMPIQRWVFEHKIKSTLGTDVGSIVDMISQQIDKIGGKLLIVTWKYMVSRSRDRDVEDKHIDIMDIISHRLDAAGYADRYSIIYRGSGQDRATNSFAEYAGVTFLGCWECGDSTLKLLNANYGIKSCKRNLMAAMMIQTICRVRIRKHLGDKIWVFYSSDIEGRLIEQVFDHFKSESEPSCSIEGVARAVSSERTPTLVKKVKALCRFNSQFYDAIKLGKPASITIKFADLYRAISLKEKRRRAYKHLCKKIYDQYSITLNIA